MRICEPDGWRMRRIEEPHCLEMAWTPGLRFTAAEIFRSDLIVLQILDIDRRKSNTCGHFDDQFLRNLNSRTKKYFHMLIINNKESENLIHWMPQGTSQMDYPHIAPHQMLGQTELWQTHQTFTRV